MNFVNRAGTLVGLDSLLNKQYVEVKPYGIAGHELDRYAKDKSIANIGGDINYLITPTLRINLTAYTDFAQVESDRPDTILYGFPDNFSV